MTWAIVLAGSLNEGSLKKCSVVRNEALIKIGPKCMVEYVVKALEDSVNIDKIVVVGPREELQNIFADNANVYVAEGGQTIMQSLLKGMEKVDQAVKQMLIVTSDIPLITGRVIDAFLEQGQGQDADIVYPIVAKALNKEKFPKVKRTYVKLKEGTFTGGNIFLVNPQIIKPCALQAEDLITLRKSPWRLANYIGLVFICKYLLRVLTLEEAEQRVSQLFNIKGKAITMPYPEIGIDVDKPSDLNIVKKILVNS